MKKQGAPGQTLEKRSGTVLGGTQATSNTQPTPAPRPPSIKYEEGGDVGVRQLPIVIGKAAVAAAGRMVPGYFAELTNPCLGR